MHNRSWAGFWLLSGLLGAACGSDTVSTDPCGDGFCSTDESRETCPRDCRFNCVPGDTRCEGNVLLICQADGLTERAEPCEPGQFCTLDGCSDSPGPGPDLGGDVSDAGADAIEDLGDATEDLADTADDVPDASEDVVDASGDLADTTADAVVEDLADAAVDLTDAAEDLAEESDVTDAEGTGDALEDLVEEGTGS